MKKLFELARGKHDFASVRMINEYFSVETMYEELDVQEDDDYIYMGEKGAETFDIQISKSTIHTIDNISDNLIEITMTNGYSFVVNVESDCSSNPIE